MDASFEILLPFDYDLRTLGFAIPTFEWQGVQYPQGKPEYFFGSNFRLKLSEKTDIQYILKNLPEAYQKSQWQVIEILGKGLDTYVNSLFGFELEEPQHTIEDLLVFLLNNSPKWITVFEPQYDGFNEVMQGGIEDIMLKLEKSIRGEIEGFLVYHLDKIW